MARRGGRTGTTATRPCPCGGGAYADCCGPVLAGEQVPGTAERLMRSRYTAFALHDEAHLLASWHPSTRPAGVAPDPGRRWTGLEVLSATGTTVLEATAVVEFRAHSAVRGAPDVLHERSRFVREAGRWLYVGPERVSR